MKTITLHITKNIIVSTSIALGVLTFVMLSGHFFRAFDLLSKGVAPSLLVRFLLLMIPDMLRFTLPLSILVATVLIFGRMSSDNEIVALKASGINLWQIIAPGLAICLLEPGVFTKLSNKCSLRVQKRDGDDLEYIHIQLQNGEGSLQDISAKRGRIHLDPQSLLINLELHDAIISDIAFGNGYAVAKRHLSAATITLPIDYGSSQSKKNVTRKPKFMDLKMLFGRMRLMQDAGEDVTPLMMNLHHRLSLSLSPFAFLLLGIPFGIRGKRSELSVGLLICVILALGFYVFLLLAGMLEKKPQFHPELIVWLPNLLYQAGGLVALHKIGKH